MNCLRIFGILFLFFVLVTGCDLDPDGPQPVSDDQRPRPEFGPRQSEFSDEGLLNATYSDYKHPADFYHEDLGDTSLYYTNTISIDSLDVWLELSTDAAGQALRWSERSSHLHLPFVEGAESEKFYEFIQSKIKFRAHQQSYLVRDNYDLLGNPDYGPPGDPVVFGSFQKTEFDADDAKGLIDYLWFVKNYNNGSAKVLSSYAEESDFTFDVIHYELYIVYGDWNVHDQISLLKKVYAVNRDTGVITLDKTVVRTINGVLR